MGARCQYTCTTCGYATEVFGGGDGGFFVCTTTIACGTCRELHDVVVAERKIDTGPFEDRAPRCPKSARHPFRLWKDGDACPRCGGSMENEGLTVMWD